MLYYGVEIPKFPNPSLLRPPARVGTGVPSKTPNHSKDLVESSSPLSKDSISLNTLSPLLEEVKLETETPSTTPAVRFNGTTEASQGFQNGPLLMGSEFEPAYLDEIRVLDERYPGVTDKLKKFEVEAACHGYCPAKAKEVEASVLESPPWPTTTFGSARENISAKAKELQQTHPELNTKDSSAYNFSEANKAAGDLMEALDEMFPHDQFPEIAISARSKTPCSLSKKVEKQVGRSEDFTLAHLTDTVGARIDAPDLKNMGEVARKLEEHYEGKIVAKSDYVSEPGENGYRAIHYIIDIGGRMAEIQTSTTSLRAADLATHDTVYKQEFPVSPETAQELSTAADRIMFLECLKEKGQT